MADDKHMSDYLRRFGEVQRKRLRVRRLEPIKSAIQKAQCFKVNPFDRLVELESGLMEMRNKLVDKYGYDGDDFIEACERMVAEAVHKEETEAFTRSELRERLRCYDCVHFSTQFAANDLTDSWCAKFKEQPPLFVGYCEDRVKAPDVIKDFV